MNTQKTGNLGEHAARAFLENKGYMFVAQNFRSRYGEIDLIMQDGAVLVFVEVKTRKNANFAAGYEAVNRHKIERIRQTAEIWLSENDRTESGRFDVIEVYVSTAKLEKSPEITHWEDAFY